MRKACTLPADVLIFDLEDGVSPDTKDKARDTIAEHLKQDDFSHHTTVIRLNHSSTDWHLADVNMAAYSGCDAIMLSKANSVKEVKLAARLLAQQGAADKPLWLNIETPKGICNLEAMAQLPQVQALVMGTNDLRNDLRIRQSSERTGMQYALQKTVMCARAYHKIAFDGTWVNLSDDEGLQREAEQGRMLGFDGKTLIHPKQIEVANHLFSPTPDEFEEAEAIVATYEEAIQQHRAVTLLNGRMIERLHYDRAKELLNLKEKLAA